MTHLTQHVVQTLRGVWGRFLLAMILAAFCGVTVAFYLGTVGDVATVSVQELDGVVLRGRSLNLRVTGTRYRFCARTVERWMQRDTDEVDPHTGRPIPEMVPVPYNSPGPPTPIGVPFTYVLTIPLPADVTPGKWDYRSEARDTCGWFPFFDRAPRTAATAVQVEP